MIKLNWVVTAVLLGFMMSAFYWGGYRAAELMGERVQSATVSTCVAVVEEAVSDAIEVFTAK